MDFRQSIVIQRLRERGPQLSERDIRAFEDEIGSLLPTDYREFLLEFNGGCNYEEEFIKFPSPGGPVGDEIGSFSFFRLKAVSRHQATDMRIELEWHKDRIPSGTIPIGSANCDDLLLLDARDGGKLYLWARDLEVAVDSPEHNRFFLANCFTDFLLGCRYVSGEEEELYALETEEPFLSIELRRDEELKECLDDGFVMVETNNQEQTALYVACRELNYEAAEELLRRGADPDDGDRGRGYPPIFAAAAPGASELVALLLSYGASPYMDVDKTRHVLDSLPTPPTEHMRNVFASARQKHPS